MPFHKGLEDFFKESTQKGLEAIDVVSGPNTALSESRQKRFEKSEKDRLKDKLKTAKTTVLGQGNDPNALVNNILNPSQKRIGSKGSTILTQNQTRPTLLGSLV